MQKHRNGMKFAYLLLKAMLLGFRVVIITKGENLMPRVAILFVSAIVALASVDEDISLQGESDSFRHFVPHLSPSWSSTSVIAASSENLSDLESMDGLFDWLRNHKQRTLTDRSAFNSHSAAAVSGRLAATEQVANAQTAVTGQSDLVMEGTALLVSRENNAFLNDQTFIVDLLADKIPESVIIAAMGLVFGVAGMAYRNRRLTAVSHEVS